MTKRLAPPSGFPPPDEARLENGTTLDLPSLAQEICRRYREEFPDEIERYGDAGMAWCRHDNQHILAWGAMATRGHLDLWSKIEWLAGVLAARDFPLPRLARNLEIAAEVLGEIAPEADGGVGIELRAAAGRVRELPSGT